MTSPGEETLNTASLITIISVDVSQSKRSQTNEALDTPCGTVCISRIKVDASIARRNFRYARRAILSLASALSFEKEDVSVGDFYVFTNYTTHQSVPILYR